VEALLPSVRYFAEERLTQARYCIAITPLFQQWFRLEIQWWFKILIMNNFITTAPNDISVEFGNILSNILVILGVCGYYLISFCEQDILIELQ